MTDPNFKIIEKYVLGSFQETFLQELVPGTEIYNFKKCMHILNSRPEKMTKEDHLIINKFLNSYSTTI